MASCRYKRNKFVQQIGLTVVGAVKLQVRSTQIPWRAISCTGKLSYFQSSGRQLTSLSTKSRPSEKTDFVRTTHRGRCGGTRVQQGGSERSKSSWSCHFPRDNTSTSPHLCSFVREVKSNICFLHNYYHWFRNRFLGQVFNFLVCVFVTEITELTN